MQLEAFRVNTHYKLAFNWRLRIDRPCQACGKGISDRAGMLSATISIVTLLLEHGARPIFFAVVTMIMLSKLPTALLCNI